MRGNDRPDYLAATFQNEAAAPPFQLISRHRDDQIALAKRFPVQPIRLVEDDLVRACRTGRAARRAVQYLHEILPRRARRMRDDYHRVNTPTEVRLKNIPRIHGLKPLRAAARKDRKAARATADSWRTLPP